MCRLNPTCSKLYQLVYPLLSFKSQWQSMKSNSWPKHEYKNPPVPRGLVGQSHIPSILSPAYTDPGNLLSGAGMDSKHRTGIQTGLPLRRLPVQPQAVQGLPDPGPVAEPTIKDSETAFRTVLSGQTADVPNRST